MKKKFLFTILLLGLVVDLYGEPFSLVFLVDAPHLDCSNNNTLIKTIAKHPSNGSKNGDVGHAWIYLQGVIDGKKVFVEGGHSGELGITQAKYFDGIMNYIEYGYANPNLEQQRNPRYEPNPIKYLWAVQHDGFFQRGCGRHRPTFAAKIEITEDQFHRILKFIQPQNYNYRDYSLIGNQCSSFVVQVASLVNFQIESKQAIPIQQYLVAKGECFKLWEDPQYSTLIISSPDAIECSLKRAVRERRAVNALDWYLRKSRR
jgi:hypothetical protein